MYMIWFLMEIEWTEVSSGSSSSNADADWCNKDKDRHGRQWKTNRNLSMLYQKLNVVEVWNRKTKHFFFCLLHIRFGSVKCVFLAIVVPVCCLCLVHVCYWVGLGLFSNHQNKKHSFCLMLHLFRDSEAILILVALPMMMMMILVFVLAVDSLFLSL